MPAYYNEIDHNAAAWLKELVSDGLIAGGDVDTRDIRDVVPAELVGRTQCHFFAGIGVWSHALRLAGWADDRPVWTGSCPCQPFSEAGRRAGIADERHLWPSWFHLIEQCRPPVVLGEQVASGPAGEWLDLVHSDLEGIGYAFGAAVLPAAGVGAPHGRHRIFFVADSGCERRGGVEIRLQRGESRSDRTEVARDGGSCILADDQRQRVRGEGLGTLGTAAGGVQGTDGQRQRVRPDAEPGGAPAAVGLADSSISGLEVLGQQQARRQLAAPERGGEAGGHGRPSSTNSHWRDADWLRCRDGKWRPVEPGTFPLVNGSPAGMVPIGDSCVEVDASPEARTMRIKGYGNAIVAQVAAAFIKAYMESNAA